MMLYHRSLLQMHQVCKNGIRKISGGVKTGKGWEGQK